MIVRPFLFLAVLASLAGCGAATSPEGAEVDEDRLVGDFIAAVNSGDVEGALTMLADDAESVSAGPLRDEDARRAFLEILTTCELEQETPAEPATPGLALDTVYPLYIHRDGENCPGHASDGALAIRVEQGKIVELP